MIPTFDLAPVRRFLLVSPTWLFRPATPLWAYAEQADLAGKEVVLVMTGASRFEQAAIDAFAKRVSSAGPLRTSRPAFSKLRAERPIRRTGFHLASVDASLITSPTSSRRSVHHDPEELHRTAVFTTRVMISPSRMGPPPRDAAPRNLGGARGRGGRLKP